MSVSKGKNQQDLKKQNRALILKLICTGRCSSRADIARQTGLAKMTVTNVISELISAGFIVEGLTSEKTTVGRKAIFLHPTKNNYFSVGIYLSRDFMLFSLLSLEAKIIKKHTIYFENSESKESLIEKIFFGINIILKDEEKSKILGIGIASIGPIDIENGVLLNPTDFYDIKNVPLKNILEKKTNLPVIVNNDMNAAALAELLYGKRKKNNNFIYVGITHGIGSGIIINGALYTGEGGFSGEIGHTTINFDGPVCPCGNKGCLEVYASIPNITQKVKEQTKKELSFEQIVLFAQKGTSPFKELIDDTCFYIGCALANSINTLDSKSIYLGHDAAKGGEYFAKRIEEIINNRILFKKNKHVSVEISSFKEQTPVIGSGVLVLNELFL